MGYILQKDRRIIEKKIKAPRDTAYTNKVNFGIKTRKINYINNAHHYSFNNVFVNSEIKSILHFFLLFCIYSVYIYSTQVYLFLYFDFKPR